MLLAKMTIEFLRSLNPNLYEVIKFRWKAEG